MRTSHMPISAFFVLHAMPCTPFGPRDNIIDGGNILARCALRGDMSLQFHNSDLYMHMQALYREEIPINRFQMGEVLH